jgi:hypothetical protein
MTGILKVDQWKDSGDNTLMTSDGAGVLTANAGITIPLGATITNNGTASGFPGLGKIGQVVIGERTTQTSLGTGSFVDLNLSQSITPTSTSSKILILGSIMGCQVDTAANSRLDIRLQRDIAGGGYSSIASTSGANYFRTGTTLSFRAGGFSFNFIDSPSSTGSVTYKFQGQGVDCSASGAFTNKDGNSGRSTIILLEILP